MNVREFFNFLAEQSFQFLRQHDPNFTGIPDYLIDEDEVGTALEFSTLYQTITYRKFGFPFPVEAAPESLGLPSNRVNVGLLQPVSEDTLAVLREGGNQSAEANFLLLVNRNWLKLFRWFGFPLRAKRALTFSGGKLYHVRFKKPVPLHYLGDFTGEIEKRKFTRNVPSSSNAEVGAITGSKERTFKLLAEKNFKNIPRTLTISNPATAESEVRGFLAKTGAMVIKPSKGQCGSDVALFDIHSITAAVQHAQHLLQLKATVVMQERIIPPWINIDGEEHDWNFRVFVSRDENDHPVVSDIAVRHDKRNGPINISLGAKVMTYEKLAEALGLDLPTAQILREEVESISTRAFAIIEEESAKITIPIHRPDFMGVDVMVRKEGERWVPYIIEVNDQHSGGMWDLDNVAEGDRVGKSSRDFTRAMIRKARSFNRTLMTLR